MAHVKVIRRSMRPEEWTKLRFVWLQRGIYNQKYEITDLKIRDARQISEGQYEYFSEDYRPLKKDDMYFTPDGTVFIQGHVTIPEHLKGKELYFSLHTAAEMIVKINGKYIGGIDPNRDRILLNPYIDSDELNIEIEGYNRSKPDDERNPAALSSRGCRQIFDGAYLATIHNHIQSFVYDCILFLDIAQCEYFNEDYRKFVFRELSKAFDLIDFDTFEGVSEAAEYVETHLYSNTDYKGSGDVALVGHSHLDIAYYWRRIHAVQKNARTVLIQLRLMDRYPEFRYTHTQAYTYETLEKFYPELFEELKEKIASGQFEPVGAMYIEPDCNVPSAESLIRQCLYGQTYFRKAFGMTVDNAWLPDVFGNSWILPQILKKSGVNYFVSNKMSTWNDTNRFPHNNFIWKGIDGSSVYACVPPTHFITWNMPSQIQENWEAYQDKQTGGQTLNMYGYGDGGSGCTEEMLEMVRRFDKLSIMPKIEMTGGADFLHKNFDGNPELATWDGELYLEMHRGTFTTKANLKKANRMLEAKFRETEMLCTLAYLNGKEYPADELVDCYKKFLLNQFHDILPGSHVHPVYEDAMADYADITSRLNNLCAQAAGDSYFNTLNFTRTSMTFIEDEHGNMVRHGNKGFWTVPKLEGLTNGQAAAPVQKKNWLTCTSCEDDTLLVETPFYRAKLAADGSFISLFDKELDREWIKDGCGFNKMHLYSDKPGIYDAWDILPNYKDIEYQINVSSPLTLTNCDETSAEFMVTFKTDNSTWTMVLRMFADYRGIEAEHIVDWHENHKLMKVNFGPDILTRELICDTSAGFIKRELTKNTTWQQARFEVCHHRWCDLSEGDCGVALINENKYGVGLEGDEISLSLLRATMRPDITSDLGQHNFCYMILPHRGDAVTANINDIAAEYNTPLSKTELSVPSVLRDVLNKCKLHLLAMKLSEEGNTIVLRLSEQNGHRGKIKFPFEVQVMNLIEDVESTASVIPYHPFELITIGIKPEALI